MANCDGYNCSALMGNWHEQRSAFKQHSLLKPEEREARNDHDITYTTRDAVKPLSRISRANPWNTKGVVIDRGESNFETLHKWSFQQSRLDHFYGKGDERPLTKDTTLTKNTTIEPTLQTTGAKEYPMINDNNSYQAHIKRNVPMNSTNFASTLKKHPKGHDQFYNLTSYQLMTSKKPKVTKEQEAIDEKKRNDTAAGVETDSLYKDGLKMTSILTAEQYRDFPDPQHNTESQRAWVYGQENALLTAKGK